MWFHRAAPFVGILLLFQRTTADLKPQYHLIDIPLTWHEAQSFCRVKYTDLVTVNNMDDNIKLVFTLGGHVTDSWIGLQKGKTDRWMWSDGRGTVRFTKWADGEPNNVGGNEKCAEVSETGEWIDIECEETKGYVCYERRQDGMQRFVYYSNKMNFLDSQEQCRKRHSDLASVATELDNSEITGLASGQKVWIGLFRDAWTWSDGGQTSFRFWLSGSHDWANCASAAASLPGRWVVSHCHNKASFVCQGGLKVKKMFIRIKVRSDVDLTDSTVRETLLEKLESDLTQQQLTDFTLSWQRDRGGPVFHRHKRLEVTETVKGC